MQRKKKKIKIFITILKVAAFICISSVLYYILRSFFILDAYFAFVTKRALLDSLSNCWQEFIDKIDILSVLNTHLGDWHKPYLLPILKFRGFKTTIDICTDKYCAICRSYEIWSHDKAELVQHIGAVVEAETLLMIYVLLYIFLVYKAYRFLFKKKEKRLLSYISSWYNEHKPLIGIYRYISARPFLNLITKRVLLFFAHLPLHSILEIFRLLTMQIAYGLIKLFFYLFRYIVSCIHEELLAKYLANFRHEHYKDYYTTKNYIEKINVLFIKPKFEIITRANGRKWAVPHHSVTVNVWISLFIGFKHLAFWDGLMIILKYLWDKGYGPRITSLIERNAPSWLSEKLINIIYRTLNLRIFFYNANKGLYLAYLNNEHLSEFTTYSLTDFNNIFVLNIFIFLF